MIVGWQHHERKLAVQWLKPVTSAKGNLTNLLTHFSIENMRTMCTTLIRLLLLPYRWIFSLEYNKQEFQETRNLMTGVRLLGDDCYVVLLREYYPFLIENAWLSHSHMYYIYGSNHWRKYTHIHCWFRRTVWVDQQGRRTTTNLTSTSIHHSYARPIVKLNSMGDRSHWWKACWGGLWCPSWTHIYSTSTDAVNPLLITRSYA